MLSLQARENSPLTRSICSSRIHTFSSAPIERSEQAQKASAIILLELTRSANLSRLSKFVGATSKWTREFVF